MRFKKNGILENSICYLIGPIDDVVDQGKGWRKEFSKKIKQHGLSIKCLDPTNKISIMKKEIDEEHIKVCRMKKKEQWDDLSSFMRTVVHHDHRCIDISDFIICYIDVDCHMCGSYFELQSALTEKKPYFLIVKQGKKETPAWLFGILKHNNIFGSVDDVVEYLVNINNGKTEIDDRWVLIRKELEGL